MYIDKLKEKNKEIETLNDSTTRLRDQLKTAQDEIISTKIQIASLSSGKHEMPNEPGHLGKPCVLLIGTSNIKYIQESKLSDNMQIKKFVKYTIDETCEFIETHEFIETPDLVVLHPLTNDLKDMTPEACVVKLEKLVAMIRVKWPHAKIVISLATPRKDDIRFHTKGQIINALIKQ